MTLGFSRPPARPPPLWLVQLACRMDSASALRSRSFRCCRIAHCFQLVSHTNNSSTVISGLRKASRSRWAVSSTYPIQVNYTDSRPRARWYQLRGLPLVGSECVCPQCNNLSLSHGEVPSHRRSAFPSISQELTRNANRKSGTPVTVNSPTVECPMVRPQRYKTQLLWSQTETEKNPEK